MLAPIAIGVSLLVANVLVQTSVIWHVVRYLAREFASARDGTGELREGAALSRVMVLMFSGHLVQIGLWALVFQALGEFDSFAGAFYHSSVNFSALGYGDIVMSERWRLLGALEAGAGVLMFGVSTALFFAVIAKMLDRRIHVERGSAR